jgi:hypothetical protein
MTKLPENVINFLRAYAKWAYEDGAPDNKPFWRYLGLCSNADRTRDIYGVEHSDILKHTGGSYPFGGEITYWDEFFRGAAHLNELRKAWVLARIKEADE